tara:strand:- start:166 stop:597 length:432 start_codon:yes stop_codon:yes gene_type:complete
MRIYIKLFLIFIFIFSTSSNAKDNYFDEAKKLYENKKYDESKFLFQRNIVFNPKDSESYYYLAKIFEYEKNENETEKNLNTALLLKPNNEKALYMLIDIKLNRSNFSKVKELSDNFKIICSSLCEKMESINERLKDFQEKNES